MHVTERWKPIKFHPNYEVSNTGKVRNVSTGLELFPSRHLASGKFRVGLFTDNKLTVRYIHRLVAAAFLDDYEEEYEVLHRSDDFQDCSVLNLEMGTKRCRRPYGPA